MLAGLVAVPSGFSEADLHDRRCSGRSGIPKSVRWRPSAAEQTLGPSQPAADAKTLVITAGDGYSAETGLAGCGPAPTAWLLSPTHRASSNS